jgi:hypothetical protein
VQFADGGLKAVWKNSSGGAGLKGRFQSFPSAAASQFPLRRNPGHMKIEEVQELVSQAFVLDLSAKYLLVVPRTVGPDHAMELQEWLVGQGLNVIILPVEDCRLFKIEN